MSNPSHLYVPWSLEARTAQKFLEHHLRGREVIKLIRDEQWLEVIHVPSKLRSITF